MAEAAETEFERPPRSDDSVGGLDRKPAGARPWLELLAVLALIVLAMVAVLPQVARHAPLSALDEPSHFDYAWHASQLEIPAAGDAIAPEVVAVWNCYGNELLRLPTCGTEGPPEAYPALGQQYNFSHPPIYYLVTGFAARAIDAATDWDFLTAARGLGAVWLAAGMAVMHLALRRFGVGLALSAAVAGASGTWWAALSATTIVTNDAPFLLTTALGLLALGGLVRAPSTRSRWLHGGLLVAVAALATGIKVMNALPFLALAGAFLLLALLPERYRPWARRGPLAAVAGGLVAAVGTVYVLWTRFQSGRGDPDWQNPVEGVNTSEFHGLPLGEWLPTLTRGLRELGHAYVTDGAAYQPLVSFVADVAAIVGLGAVAIAIVVARRGSALSVIAIAALIGLASWPLIVQLQSYLSSGGTHYFARPSARYGITMGTLAFAALALVAERIRWQRVAIAGCVLLIATTLIAVQIGGTP